MYDKNQIIELRKDTTCLTLQVSNGMSFSLQNKMWNLPERSTILPRFIYDKEGKLVGPTQILH